MALCCCTQSVSLVGPISVTAGTNSMSRGYVWTHTRISVDSFVETIALFVPNILCMYDLTVSYILSISQYR